MQDDRTFCILRINRNYADSSEKEDFAKNLVLETVRESNLQLGYLTDSWFVLSVKACTVLSLNFRLYSLWKKEGINIEIKSKMQQVKTAPKKEQSTAGTEQLFEKLNDDSKK